MSHREDPDKRLLRIYLVGFMCSGKTSFGRLLSKLTGWEFIDVDEEIERRESLSIPEIFERKGEEYFRRLELEVLKDLSNREKVIISTGGGLGANEEAMGFMKSKGVVIWLKVSFEEFMRRCRGDENRPLLKKGEKFLRDLMRAREEVYSRAHIHIEHLDPRILF